jgi:hypothetical protein
MSFNWNLSSDEEDDFEHWAEGRHQQLLSQAFVAGAGPSNDDYSVVVDHDNDSDTMDCKPAAVEDGVPLFSDFDHQVDDDDSDDENNNEVDWEDALENNHDDNGKGQLSNVARKNQLPKRSFVSIICLVTCNNFCTSFDGYT